MNEDLITESSCTAIINAPIDFVDIPTWLFHLPDAEYQRCSPAHIAAASTTTDDGRRMSINVEKIGETLMIQHYVSEITEPHLCRMASFSDAISANGRTKVHVLWELSIKPIGSTPRSVSRPVRSRSIPQSSAAAAPSSCAALP